MSTDTERDSAADRFADDPAFAVHEGGKLSVVPTRSIDSIADLALTYTPGVARVSSAIAAEPELAQRVTWAARVSSAIAAEPADAQRFPCAPRVVRVLSDGQAVLGLAVGGAVASLQVME